MIKEIRRWNFEAHDDGVYVCKGDHATSDCCQMEKLTTYEIVDILNDLRSECLQHEQMKYTHEEALDIAKKYGLPDKFYL